MPRRILVCGPALLLGLGVGWFAPRGVAAQRPVDAGDPGGSAGAHVLTATVVSIDGDELVLDLGREQLAAGAAMTLYRTIEVRHPVTGERLRDRFHNGELRIVQTGRTLSVARVEGASAHPPAVGDTAELVVQGPTESQPRVQTQEAASERSCPQCERVVDAQGELLDIWYRSLGREPAERIALMRAFLDAHPNHSYRTWFEKEIAFFEDNRYAQGALRIQMERARHVLEKQVYIDPPQRARHGAPLSIAVYKNPELEVRAVRLFVRRDRRSGAYRGLTLSLDERGQGRVKVPDELIAPPGFAYFLEVELPDAQTLRVIGSDEAPEYCRVLTMPDEPDPSGVSRVRISSEYVSFDGLSGRDAYAIFEADYLVRFPYSVLRYVRLGYGHYRGDGGTVDALDEREEEPQEAAFTYGYLEGAFAIQPWLGVMPRVGVGLGRAEEDEARRFDSEVRAGAQLRIRLGPERGTHLVLAGETVPEIGQRAFVGLNLGVVERIPIAFEVHVTDQPVNTDELGVRVVLDVGYRLGDVVALSARASYQGRTIDHTGPGLGLAATFDW